MVKSKLSVSELIAYVIAISAILFTVIMIIIASLK
jgi:hypothetical protein